MSITFRPATDRDGAFIGAHLREVDRREIVRGTGGLPPLAPGKSIEQSIIAWTAVDERGDPIAVFGVAPTGVQDVGAVWLLATEGVEKHARAFIHSGRYYVALMAKLFACLINAVDSENTRTRRWLRALGFEETGTCVGRTGHPFVIVKYHHV